MIDEINNIRSIVKKEILKKYGLEVLYAKDCENLSSSILNKTNRQLSHSTLKRFFGIVNTPFKPSNYTRDTIAIYLNFKDWKELIFELNENRISLVEPDYWDRLNNRIQVVTNESLNSIKAKIGAQYDNFPIRVFAVKKIRNFLNSKKTATAFIAPGGYGKTSVIAQLTEMFFTGENAKYPKDIVCLIDGSILVNLIDLNLEMMRMKNVVDFDPENSFSVYFRKNPDQVKGRFVLIIESLYEIYNKEEKLIYFVENLMDIISSFKDFPWFKIIVTCRPEDWKIFTNIVHKSPQLKSLWFDVNFETKLANTVNVPPLNSNEIRHYFKRNNSALTFEYLNFNHPEIIDIVNNPYFLHLFGRSQNPENIHSDIELLTKFVQIKVLIEPYLEEKSKIINAFFKLSNYAKSSSSVEKKDLPEMTYFNLAYKELISNNVLYEYTVQGNYLAVKTFVKFTNDILLGFFLTNKWIEENNFNLKLIRHIYKFYEKNSKLQVDILKYMIKYAFQEGNAEILKNIFTVFIYENEIHFDAELKQVNSEIINVIGIGIRKNKIMRDILIPFYAKSKAGQHIYFESFFDMDSLVLHSGDNIKYYLENKQTADAFIYGHFLKFMQYFLSGNIKNCQIEYELFQSTILEENIKPGIAGYYFGAQLIYQSVFFDKIEPDIIEKIFRKSEVFYETGVQQKTVNPIFEHIIIYSLNYGDRFEEICKLIDLMLSRFEVVRSSVTWHNQLSKIIYARALLNTGKPEQAFDLFKKVELNVIPVNYKNYVKIRFNLVSAEFLIHDKKYKEAKLLIEEIKTVSQMLKLKFFYDKAIILENNIYKTVLRD